MGYRLEELHGLVLEGQLHIKCLELAVWALDAKSKDANLIAKTGLRQLRLSWTQTQHNSDTINAADEQVLDALEPHPNLKYLKIENYRGTVFPNWMNNISAVKNLVRIELDEFRNCLGLLPLAFPSLEELNLYELPNLEKFLRDGAVAGSHQITFPRLYKLDISAVPKLILPRLPSVRNLCASRCKEWLLRSISNCYALTSLEICNCEDLTSFPSGMMQELTCLKNLCLNGFARLENLPNELIHLNDLEKLEVAFCDGILTFPEHVLQGLISLQTLDISYSRRLKSLSEGFGHLTSLENLQISDCPEPVFAKWYLPPLLPSVV
ncbi:Disease resistance protein [Quillaja saponaria]|uniref:Disease resistance protein n=1 Tax=Quillaja saponaria TaxID=32244 RepID=A0AAD7L9V1_QUISA|nr:Disease resistance protein [Quillaja saponaria]